MYIDNNKKIFEDVIEKYERLYEGQIRHPDPEWVKQTAAKLNTHNERVRFANGAHNIFNSYKSSATKDSKITFVLWKYNSDCQALMEAGYCMACKSSCDHCPVNQAAIKQLELIEQNLDRPETFLPSISNVKIEDNKIKFNYGSNRIELLIKNTEEEKR